MSSSEPLNHKFVCEIIEGAKQAENDTDSECYPCSSLGPTHIHHKREKHIKQENHTKRPTHTNDVWLIVWKQDENQICFCKALNDMT